MKIEISHRFSTSASKLAAILASKELMEAREQAIRTQFGATAQETPDYSPDYSFTQEQDPQGKITKTLFRFTAPLDLIPAKARKFLSKGAAVQIESLFSPPAPKYLVPTQSAQITQPEFDTAQIDCKIELTGVPVSITGAATIQGTTAASEAAVNTGASCNCTETAMLTYRGELNVKIPFIGKVVETKAHEALPAIFQRDCKLIEQLLK